MWITTIYTKSNLAHNILNKLIFPTVLICFYCNAQTSDFIVTTSRDTINVDKISLTDFEVKTKSAGKKKNYKIEEIASYYVFKENKYYERTPVEKKERREPDKYDYRRNEDIHLEEYQNRIKYRFLHRLTAGKVKLFTEFIYEMGVGAPSQPGYIAPGKKDIYYISILDSKLELLSDFGPLRLDENVMEILKTYLYGNNEITKKIDRLSLKGTTGEREIVELINEYNRWANLNNP